MRVLFAGTPEAALPTLEALIASEHDVVGVLTRADARKGRGRTLHPSPVAAVARDAGLDVRTPATLKGEQADDVHAWIGALKADVAVVVAYGRLVPADLLDVPEHGWLNLHFSLLPAWRGAAPVQRAVIAGEEVTGACVFRLEEGLDTGPVYGRLTEAISGRDTSGDLLERLARAGAPLVLDVLRRVEDGSVRPEPQDDALATLAPVLSSADGLIRWEDPALAIDRRIRGVTPAPSGPGHPGPGGHRSVARPAARHQARGPRGNRGLCRPSGAGRARRAQLDACRRLGQGSASGGGGRPGDLVRDERRR